MKYSILILLPFFLAACQTQPSSDPNYASAYQYQDYNCKQISKEMQRVSNKMNATSTNSETDTASTVLGSAIMIYGISQGYGFYSDNNNASETQRLAATYDALEQLSIQKKLLIRKQIN